METFTDPPDAQLCPFCDLMVVCNLKGLASATIGWHMTLHHEQVVGRSQLSSDFEYMEHAIGKAGLLHSVYVSETETRMLVHGKTTDPGYDMLHNGSVEMIFEPTGALRRLRGYNDHIPVMGFWRRVRWMILGHSLS